LVGERDSWDMKSLTSGMGGGGMGKSGGGGGARGGFRSVPPAAPASALVKPGQTRRLPTPLVRLSGPPADGDLAMPRLGEPLKIRDVDTLAGASPRLRTAVKRLAQEKAPQTVAQLVLLRFGTIRVGDPGTPGYDPSRKCRPGELGGGCGEVARERADLVWKWGGEASDERYSRLTCAARDGSVGLARNARLGRRD